MEKARIKRGGAAVVFDSGIGGLNLLFECARRAPQLEYYYVSDSANVPYGNKTAEEIYNLTVSALEGIEKLNPRALVIACNTVTARCVSDLRAKYSFPVIGIQPAIKQASEIGGKCLALATQATVNSGAFKALVSSFGGANVTAVACRELARYVEENVFSLPDPLPQGLLPDFQPDCVVLGCTHYSFVKKQIEERYKCPVFDGIAGTADHFAKIIGTGDHLKPLLGKFDHHALKRLKITFNGGNCDKNLQIFEKFFSFNV